MNSNYTCRTIIDQIAELCPLAGGVAVYNARSLQMLYNDTLQYDDHELCRLQGIAYRKAEEKTNSEDLLKIYPVPSSEFLTLELDADELERVNYTIYDLFGKQVFKSTFYNTTQTLYLPSICKAEGIYLIELISDSGHVFKRKFSYVKN